MKKYIIDEDKLFKNNYSIDRREVGRQTLSRALGYALTENRRKIEREIKRAFEESEEGKKIRSSMLRKQAEYKENVSASTKAYEIMIKSKDSIVDYLKKNLSGESSVKEIENVYLSLENDIDNFSLDYNKIKSFINHTLSDPKILFFKEMVKYNVRFLAFAPKEVLVLAGYSFTKLNEEDKNAVRNRYEQLGLCEDEKVNRLYSISLKFEKKVEDMNFDEAKHHCKSNPSDYTKLNQTVKNQLKEELNFKTWYRQVPKTIRYFSKAELERFASISPRFGDYLVKYPEILENENFTNNFLAKHDVGVIFQGKSKKNIVENLSEYFNRFPIIEKYCSISSISRANGSKYNPKTDTVNSIF